MAGIRLLDGIHGKEADGIGHPVVLFALGHGRSLGWRVCNGPCEGSRHIAVAGFVSTKRAECRARDIAEILRPRRYGGSRASGNRRRPATARACGGGWDSRGTARRMAATSRRSTSFQPAVARRPRPTKPSKVRIMPRPSMAAAISSSPDFAIERPLRHDLDHLAVALELPGRRRAAGEAVADAGMVEQVARDAAAGHARRNRRARRRRRNAAGAVRSARRSCRAPAARRSARRRRSRPPARR